MDSPMNRREFAGVLGTSALLGAISGSVAGPAGAHAADAQGPPSGKRPSIAMLVHPDMILLDLAGPQTVFSLLMAEVHLVGKSLAPVATDVGIRVQPTVTFTDCPQNLDVLFVPGGLRGTIGLMDDPETLAFLADRGQRARYATSVCTGSLALAAAGLLRGHRATSHWYVRHLLPIMGAVEAPGRVVEDRGRITGGGVTAGIDFGLYLAAKLRGEDYARRIQLVIEYDPAPPFASGSPERADPAAVEDVRQRRAPLIKAAEAAARRAAAR